MPQLGSVLVLGLLILSPGVSAAAAAREYWVAPEGSDTNSGSATRPFASPAAAEAFIRAQRRAGRIGATEPVHIYLRGGVYFLPSPLTFTGAGPQTVEAAPGEQPVLSGGGKITGWKVLTKSIRGLPPVSRERVWMADAPLVNGKVLPIRDLWVDGHRAIRAREPNDNGFLRLTGWNKTNRTAFIPASAIAKVRNSRGVEMIIDQVWEIADLRVDKVRLRGTNAAVTFKQPESGVEFAHPWPPVIVKSTYAAPFFLANAIEFLDSPGEWFEDVRAGKIYYWPREGEDPDRSTVITPALETLVAISGTPDQPASDITFKGVTFSHTTWLRPSLQGHVPLQAGMYMLDAHKLSPHGTPYHPGLDNVAWIGRRPAAVLVQNADHISFDRCRFEHLASSGLDFTARTHDDRVEGCTFQDIGGNGIQLGKFSDTNVETHAPWNPADETEICSNIKISNNVVADCGVVDWGCVGIGVGYARDIRIEHNEVFNLPYSGVSVGWGWTRMTNALRDNSILANHIHHVGRLLNDLGGIYTLSAQPGTIVADNVVSDIEPSPWVPDPQHWFYLYADEGSSFITFRDNWCPSEKFLRNANGPGNVWTNNGPQVSAEIKAAAGLEPAFRDLLP
ncbi:MAG TPA: right-handed parallel beta-helix repeat-containing protein [Verrucomicrobiae bacterium]|nr:right-handed parallel beta-helix repeat-containing protein [Verrucomicrobiae bacterium]